VSDLKIATAINILKIVVLDRFAHSCTTRQRPVGVTASARIVVRSLDRNAQ
jgi:hypothetical protein